MEKPVSLISGGFVLTVTEKNTYIKVQLKNWVNT